MFDRDTKILVVDDSLNHRQLIFDSLKKLGFKSITTSENVNDAFMKLNSEEDKGTPFNLILSDLNMPGLSGLDFLKMVRETEKFKVLPFLLITTESEKGAVIQAAMNGVSSYIVKPFSVETLTKRLDEAWKKHKS
ncbi:MAG: response regulator [Bdellovibrionaceae bacterium]|nr:response regulator [Pseudobdellovibrionaceae bacterium]